MFCSSTAAAAQQQWWRRRRVAVLVPAPRVKPERQMKKMEHRSGTFFRDSAYYKYALRADQHCGSCPAMHRGSWSSRSSSTAAAAQQQQRSSSGGGHVELLLLVPAPRVKPERQMKKMEHRSGTFVRDSLHIMHCGSALRIVLRDASRIVEQQKQQYISSSTAAAAQQQQHSSSGGSCLLYTSPSPRDATLSRMPSSA